MTASDPPPDARPVLPRLRHLLAGLRHAAARIRRPQVVGRWYRGLTYVWHLLVWSRIAAGRTGALPIELPPAVLRGKGITLPPPHLEAAGHPDAQAINDGFAEVYALLFANLQRADLLSSTRHAIPGPAFRGVYLWDSAFIAQVWGWWDPTVAAEVLNAVVELRDGDRLQHVVTEFHESPYTQPPLIAWSLARLAERLPAPAARALAGRHFDVLCAYHDWLNRHRRLDNGLYAWAHPYESGVENAPRFSNTDESALRRTTHIAAADFSSYVVLQLEALAGLAVLSGRGAAADHYAGEAQLLRRRIDALLWDERDGLYYDRDGAGSPVRVATIAALLPLWAGVPDAARAERLVARILAPDGFGTRMPLPSVARGEPHFERDMWRGPVWLNTAYGVIQGLLRYGREQAAAELAWRLCLGVYRVFAEERRIYEFYDPDHHHTRHLHRKRGNRWKAFTLGTGPQKDFVGWTGLANNLLLEVVLGLEARAGRLRLCPRLPPAAAGLRLSLRLPRHDVRLGLQADAAGTVTGSVTQRGRSAAFTTARGSAVDLTAVLDGATEGTLPCASAT
ncbi:trehalase family glycosidase [uncultured Thiohalocapsa sp.]|uniref:MGH1-like glycoside hydrolase domain-containing protein n=1 Tax=uncultured Thiohalocapsa sp. TaxID=768990 RepID=UPI0025F260E6|nr:trehalase family glycosidase [uncultured Thiohalocapsa sp.]